MAISHTWADRLFAPGMPFPETRGRRAIACLADTEYNSISYCWIDTLCIDQSDPADKQRQIPLMGDIYGNAAVVVILTLEHFGISQAEIDAVTKDVRGAVDMSVHDSWMEHGKLWTSSEKHRRRLVRAMDCLELFTRPMWGSRVWTMQEFILARRTMWVGGDLQALRVEEQLFQVIPDVCDYLSIEECIGGKYSKLYSHFQGMAGARQQQIEPTRVMELLGNRTATVPEDEVFGLMAASGVVLNETHIVGKEKVWALWWEKAIQTGHLRWALLPPATPTGVDAPGTERNCIMPAFSVRHLASSNSALDSAQPYGPVEVTDGTVSMMGRLVGRCEIVRQLGRVHQNQSDEVIRDVTLVLFASNNWSLALRIAAAFGAGRYNLKQRAIIAQVLLFNYYRAKLAVLERRTKSFRPRFRSQLQASIWADFMLLQSTHMRVMTDGLTFLARISNSINGTYVVIVTDGEIPSGSLWALDFGAVNDSEKTMFTIVKEPQGVAAADISRSCSTSGSPSLHRVGVSMYMQVTEDIDDALKYASHILDQPRTTHRYRLGGDSCPVCPTLPVPGIREDKVDLEKQHSTKMREYPTLKHRTRLKMRRQNKALKQRWKKRTRPSPQIQNKILVEQYNLPK